jgi:hypothetical protein
MFKDKGNLVELKKKKSCTKHGVGCDYLELNIWNGGLQRQGTMKNETIMDSIQEEKL